jgi:Cu(I)/Ag(I) efflux system membrane fusion protein
MKTKTLRWTVAGLLLCFGLGGLACRRADEHSGRLAGSQKVRYHCPMHPSYVSDRPGDCPICGMKLVPIGPETAPGAPAVSSTPAAPERKIAYYRSPMDPSVRSERPAKDSMGMEFLPVYQDEMAGASPSVPGRAAVTLSPERRQLLGLHSEKVRQERIERVIRTVGRVAPDERRLHHIHTKYEGYVEHLYVDFTGAFVQRGERLLSIYSPDLVATQQEYLLAYRAQKRLAESGIPSVVQGGIDLLEATRQRLLLWDIRPQDIATLEQTGEVKRSLDLYSESSGFVVQKTAFHGMRVTPADTLFDIVDLSHLWVLADVYESDLPVIRVGMSADASVPYLPGKTWRGPVTYIAPTVEEKTRTIKVRVEVDNQDGALKPDMYADVFMRVDLGIGLVVPESAVIDVGDRKLVFLDDPQGRLEPREVQLGVKLESGYQVLSGLSEGDRVVTGANFLLDSESSLKAALSAMASPAPSGSTAPSLTGHQH